MSTTSVNCDVLVFDCQSSDYDKALLAELKTIGKKDKEAFKVGYMVELGLACDNPGINQVYFIAVRYDASGQRTICGYAHVTIGKYGKTDLELETLASRSYTDASYKGIGTKLVDTVVKYFQQTPGFLGLRVHARPDAAQFYEKVGFQHLGGSKSRDFIIPFPARYNTFTYGQDEQEELYHHYSIAQQLGDRYVVGQLKSNNTL